MRTPDDDLDQYARARLAYLTAGRQPLATGPRRIVPADDDPDDDVLEPPADDVEAADHRQPILAFARSHLVAVAAVLALLLAVTAVLLMRSRASSMPLEATPAPTASGQLPTTITTAAPPATPASQTAGPAGATAVSLQVHVLGAVRRPGVVVLRAGARAHDAISAAGGLSVDGATGALNLAAPLADGDQLVIGTRAHPAGVVHHANEPAATDAGGASGGGASAGAAGGTSPGGAATTAAVDLNTATLEQLDQLPGVGPVTAQRILDFRSQHQRFTKVTELQEVDGIGPKTYERIAPHVHV